MASGSHQTTDRLERDGRCLFAPSAARNVRPIVEALRPVLQDRTGTVLEIGSGTGQHVSAFAASYPHITWQPSEQHEPYLDSIRAWAEQAVCTNIAPPIRLDVTEPWPDLGPLAGVLAINVIHIAPWQVTEGIVSGAAGHLGSGAPLIFYGPFKEGGRHTAETNAAFDLMLSAQDPSWGVRDLEDVTALAAAAGFGSPEVTSMPANNRLVGYRRR